MRDLALVESVTLRHELTTILHTPPELPSALIELTELVERRCAVYRPPDFVMLPDDDSDIRWRKLMVQSFGTGFGVGIILGSFILILVSP